MTTHATQTTERSYYDLYAQKRLRQALSLCGSTESTYNTVVVDVGPAGSVGCVARVPSKTRHSLSPRLTNKPFS